MITQVKNGAIALLEDQRDLRPLILLALMMTQRERVGYMSLFARNSV